jgi:outer membrane protein assembly factor BamB
MALNIITVKMKIIPSIILALVFTIISSAQDPTVWRNGTHGYYAEENLLDVWPETGPAVKWVNEEMGKGHSSVAITGNSIYATGLTDETGYLYKMDFSGKIIYRKAYGPEYSDSFHGPRGTPVIVGDKIYLVSGYGKLYCLGEKSGEVLWVVDMVADLGGEVITWGYNETPVVDGDIIYCTPGGKNSVVALNRHTAQLIWSCPGKGELSAYCTPLLFEHNGRKILSTHTGSHLLGIDAATGKLLWAHRHPNKYSVHANTPIYHEGELFFFSGYGQGAGKLVLNEEGTKITLAWSNPLDSRMGGAVLIDGYIYGSGDNNRDWRCVDWKTGKDMYLSKEIGKGAVVAADGKLFCYSDRGELALVNAVPDKFDLVSQIRVSYGSEQHWAHPVIHNGILYLRHGKALVAYVIR